MNFFSKIRLLIECFRIAGLPGLSAGCKYLSGLLQLDLLDPECSAYTGGVSSV